MVLLIRSKNEELMNDDVYEAHEYEPAGYPKQAVRTKRKFWQNIWRIAFKSLLSRSRR